MTDIPKKYWPNVLRIILSILFLAVGVSALVWSLVFFAGGPDGKTGSFFPLLNQAQEFSGRYSPSQ